MDASMDAHAKPPDNLRAIYKRYQKASHALEVDETVFDAPHGRLAGFTPSQRAREAVGLPDDLQEVLYHFLKSREALQARDASLSQALAYEHADVPGLYIFPSLVPPKVQLHLLNQLFHRDLSNASHKTNIHLHYEVPYPTNAAGEALSFFHPAAASLEFRPKDPTIHKPISTQSFLNRKLRWTTLGGQYDWTQKVYPSELPPPFPPDVAALVEGLFPAMKAQAAIVNLYSPGDTLSLHRDVSEECNRPLASISLGCDAIFVVGIDERSAEHSAEQGQDEVKTVTLRLRSGDAVVMSGQARFAWHSVPRVIKGTCPDWMAKWPCTSADQAHEDQELYKRWEGWMAGKRINLNVRQMWD